MFVQKQGTQHAETCLDLGNVEGSCSTAHQRPPREGQPWEALQAAFVEDPRAILQARAALEQGREEWVRFEALKLLIGAQVGVAVVQGNDVPNEPFRGQPFFNNAYQPLYLKCCLNCYLNQQECMLNSAHKR